MALGRTEAAAPEKKHTNTSLLEGKEEEDLERGCHQRYLFHFARP